MQLFECGGHAHRAWCCSQAEGEAVTQAIAREHAVAESSAAAAEERGRALDAQVFMGIMHSETESA